MRQNFANIQGAKNVCVVPTSFTSTEYNVLRDGVVEYWNDLLAVNNTGIQFNFRPYGSGCQDADIKIKRDSTITDDRPRPVVTLTGDNAEVLFPTSAVWQGFGSIPENQWRWYSAHEFGHLLDYLDAYQGGGTLPSYCQDLTVMGSAQNWDPNPKCADSQAIAQRYQTPDEFNETREEEHGCYVFTT
jgi:hypothetical protein